MNDDELGNRVFAGERLQHFKAKHDSYVVAAWLSAGAVVKRR